MKLRDDRSFSMEHFIKDFIVNQNMLKQIPHRETIIHVLIFIETGGS